MSSQTAADPALDPGAFAERVLRRPLWPHQLEVARCEAFITTVAAARRTGKTGTAELLAPFVTMREREVKALVISATLDSSRRVTEEIAAELGSRPATRGVMVDDFSTRIRLDNGSEIISLPASPRQIRGYGRGVKLVVIDEAGFVPEEVWRAAHYVALDERGAGARILLLGSPWGGPEHFFRREYQAGLEGDPDHASFHWTHEVNPHLDHAYLERQRVRVSPAEYAAEILGEWSDAAGSLFPRELLERATADFELLEWTEQRGPARPLWGTDWGVSFDRSAAVAIARLPVAQLNPERPRRAVYGLTAVRVWPPGTLLSRVVEEVAGAEATPAVLSPETNGVGAGPSQELRRRMRERPTAGVPGRYRINFVSTTAQRKTAAYGRLLWLLEEDRLVLPRHPDLLRQLAGLRFEQGEQGFLRIEAGDATVHDDVADALMLATGPYTDRRGKARSALADFDARAAADVLLDDDELELVETGSGLRVPRRPVVQSVDGAEVSVPARFRRVPALAAS